MDAIQKDFEFKILERTANGGRIIISTATLDRQGDRVFPEGAQLDNYLKNPVVIANHNYKDPWATIGRTITLTKASDGLVADFELRPAANDQDPQNIIRLLWEGGWINTASIGFIPKEGKPNNTSGTDFTKWEMLEWSLTALPANPDALALSMQKGLSQAALKNFNALVQADATLDDQTTPADQPPVRAWVRRLDADTECGHQSVFASFYTYTIAVPDDATLLQMDETLSECVEVPHPERGQTVFFKTMVLVPPLEFVNEFGETDGLISNTGRSLPDEQMLPASDYWQGATLSPVLDSIPFNLAKEFLFPLRSGMPVDLLTLRGAQRAGAIVKRMHGLTQKDLKSMDAAVINKQCDAIDAANASLMQMPPNAGNCSKIDTAVKTIRKETANEGKALEPITKRGRVISAKNESDLKSAKQDALAAAEKIDTVLKQVDEQPVTDALRLGVESAAGTPVVTDAIKALSGTVSSTCPFGCGTTIALLSWGMYRCPNCAGTFEVTAAGKITPTFPKDLTIEPIEAGTVLKGALPPHTTPTAPPDTPWDGPGVVASLPNDRKALRLVHAWVDSAGDPDAKQSYKFPHHLADGKVVLRGVNNAKARLPQSSIPQADHPGVMTHLERHANQFEKSLVLRDMARVLQEVADELSGDQHVSDDEERNLVEMLETLFHTVKEVVS